MKRIGLITYHATHNYGAVLQAYATQYTIDKMGCYCEVINFQPVTMKYFNALYKFPIGAEIPKKIKNIAAGIYRFFHYFPYDSKRRKRGKKFDDFVQTHLKITKEYNRVQELLEEKFDYETVITGSDQTWNIHCPLWRIDDRIIDYSAAYFLGFAKSAKKASFAASTSNTTAEELTPYKDLLLQYDYITVRDALAKSRIESVVNKNIDVVLDPAFLLTKEEWVSTLNVPTEPVIKNPYILLYSIHGHKEVEKLIRETKKIAEKKSLSLVCITPNACKEYTGTIQIYDAGPVDFINLYHNASYVIAATFHAIVFSIIFRKSFIAFGNKYNKDDIRKNSLLKTFNLEARLITDESDIHTYSKIDIDYSDYEGIIRDAINKSKTHLENILNLA